MPVSTGELRTLTVSLCENRNEAQKRKPRPENFLFNALMHTQSEFRWPVVPIFLLQIPFRNAECRTKTIQPGVTARNLPQHTRTHSIPSNAPNFFSLLEM